MKCNCCGRILSNSYSGEAAQFYSQGVCSNSCKTKIQLKEAGERRDWDECDRLERELEFYLGNQRAAREMSLAIRYPEGQKVKEVQKESQALGEFLDHLKEKGIYLCAQHSHSEACDKDCFLKKKEWFPISDSIEKVLAQYFCIDFEKLESEKLVMLEEIKNRK